MGKHAAAATHDPLEVHPLRRAWNMECWFLGLAGLAMLLRRDLTLQMSVVQETIVLVVFLGGLIGITRIPFPTRFFGKPIALWAYPLISGGLSGFMDSFLVLLLVGAASLEGDEGEQLKFRAYNTLAALIGGLALYFGEVYMLPLALKYGMRSWHSMLPIVPPVLAFLAVLAWLASRLNVRVVGVKSMGGGGRNVWVDWLEFLAAIALLLATHNALLCLGALLVYAFVTGQGENLIDVIKTETEMGVMLLLVFAAFVAGPIEPYMARWSGWWAFIPSVVNGVLAGAVFPASGDVWFDALILSTAVLVTPVSSLVGVMLFKTMKDWKGYIRLALPLALLWFVLAGAWFRGPWRAVEPAYARVFGVPALSSSALE